MEIITRKDAKAAGLNRYYTGLPCKNGHVDYRYTASGACKSCVGESNGRFALTGVETEPEVVAAKMALDAAQAAYNEAVRVASERRQQQLAADEAARDQARKDSRQQREVDASQSRERAEAKGQLVQVRVRLYEEDRGHVAVAAWAMAAMRAPSLTMGDIDPQLIPRDKTAGTALFAFNCYAADVEAVQQLSADSIRARGIDAAARRAQVLGQTLLAANADTAPEWCP